MMDGIWLAKIDLTLSRKFVTLDAFKLKKMGLILIPNAVWVSKRIILDLNQLVTKKRRTKLKRLKNLQKSLYIYVIYMLLFSMFC